MERNLRLLIAYEGTHFHGWQRQPGQRTAQGEFEETARRVLRHDLVVFGASRTDAGVHARGQVAHVRTTMPAPLQSIYRAIDHRLPKDVALLDLREMPLEFHASRDARSKLYRYRIHNHARRPSGELAAAFCWHVWHSLDVERMRAAAAALVGTHDFLGFAGAGSPRLTSVRTIYSVQVQQRFHEILIDFEGSGFLYNQVRNMVGTLVEVARGHWPTERVAQILASRDRREAGPTAPPQGLCLEWIRYDRPAEVARGT